MGWFALSQKHGDGWFRQSDTLKRCDHVVQMPRLNGPKKFGGRTRCQFTLALVLPRFAVLAKVLPAEDVPEVVKPAQEQCTEHHDAEANPRPGAGQQTLLPDSNCFV